jgi:DNA modification methylase
MLKPTRKRCGLDDRKVALMRVRDLKPNLKNARTHSRQQIEQIARSIDQFGFNNPILVDNGNQILAGHGRVEAAKLLGLDRIPALKIEHLSAVDKRAYVLADNKLAEQASWSKEILRIELQELTNLDFEVELTGFSAGEIDVLLGSQDAGGEDADDALPEEQPTTCAVTRAGDCWQAGDPLLVCGDAREEATYRQLMSAEKAAYAITDPPYNVKIDGHATGHGRTHHREFAMASGEMSQVEFADFLGKVFQQIRNHTTDGAICAAFMDWRHMTEMLIAGQRAFAELKNLCVWVKPTGGMGSFYRSRHELVFVWKCSRGKHINTFELGQHGRTRTNVWEYSGAEARGRTQQLQGDHPTPKSVGMIADAIQDCSRRGDLILDPFCGSGTILLAAERSGRAARAIEIDPFYCDLAIRRWQTRTGNSAIHIESNASFAEREEQALHQKEVGLRHERKNKGQSRR